MSTKPRIQHLSAAALVLLALACHAADREPLHLPWHTPSATHRQVVRVDTSVPRKNAVVTFATELPADSGLRAVTGDAPDQALPLHRGEDGTVSFILPGTLTPDNPRDVVLYAVPAGSAVAGEILAAPPALQDDYASVGDNDAWDFDEGDQENIRSWGDGPQHYGDVTVENGAMTIPVTGDDPYFIWGIMFGDPGQQPHGHGAQGPLAVDSGQYTTLSMRIRQSCEMSKWSVYLTDQHGRYRHFHVAVNGTDWITLSFDLPRLFPGFWDGRIFRALRIDPTNDSTGTVAQVDWVRLAPPAPALQVGPVLSREAVAARERAASIAGELPGTANAGEKRPLTLRPQTAENQALPNAPVAVRMVHTEAAPGPMTVGTADGSGEASLQTAACTATGDAHWLLGLCDDLGHPGSLRRKQPVTVTPTDLQSYDIIPNRIAVPVATGTVLLSVWGKDRYGNPIPVDIDAPRWQITNRAVVPNRPLTGAPATVLMTCSPDPATLHDVQLFDSNGISGRTTVTSIAYRTHRMSLSKTGYVVDRNGGLFVPLGGFYANWPGRLIDSNGNIDRSVDLFPCNAVPYPHGFPWPEKVELAVKDYLELCRKHKITSLRLMLRNVDLVGRADKHQLEAVFHLFDLARPLGIKFCVVLFEDYTKPPYGNREILETIVLPRYRASDLDNLPPYRARFLVEKRLLSQDSLRYTDDDAIACQQSYLMDLIPHLAQREEILCYELENEMVRPPMAWVKRMSEFIRTIDPFTPVLGNPGPHTWPEPVRWRDCGADLFSYHPYNDGYKTADHGAVVFMRSKWAAAAGLPMFTGEGGINQNRWQRGILKVPAPIAGRGIRDQIWLSICCGANGAMMWTPSHELEMLEFEAVLPALDTVGINLLEMRRAKPRTAVVMPNEPTANENAYTLAYELMSRGVDFDTVLPTETHGYTHVINAADHNPELPEPEFFRPAAGYQIAVFMDDGRQHALLYVRNVANRIMSFGERRPCYVRRPGLTTAAVTCVDGSQWGRALAYDLNEQQVVAVTRESGGRLYINTASDHDFILGIHRE